MRSMPANLILQLLTLAGIIAILGVVVFMAVRIFRTKNHPPAVSHVAYRMELISEAVLKAINGVVITDAEGKVVFWNRGAENLFSWKESEVLGQNLSFLMSKEDYQRHSEGMRRAQMAGGLKLSSKTYERLALHRFGEWIPVAINVSEASIKGVPHYTAIIKDIRERKEREEQRITELELLNEGEKIAGIGSWSWDVATNRVTVTEGFNRIFESDDAVTEVEYLMRRVYYKDRDRVQAVLDEAIKHRHDYDVEYRVQSLSGEMKWLRVQATMHKHENGTIKRITGTITQIKGDENGEIHI